MRYKLLYDLHTHTTFSHGKGSIEDNVKVAIEKGLKAIAITDHGPGHLTYGIKREAIPIMRKQIDLLSKKYPEIKIYLGVEANIIDNGNYLDVYSHEFRDFDIVLAGYHFGIKNGYTASNWTFNHGIGRTGKRREALANRNTEMIINAIEKNDIKILTHPGDKAPVNMDQIARACAVNDVLMEINARHKHMNVAEIRIASKEAVKFIINSDAHVPDKVGTFEESVEQALEAGLDMNRIINIRKV